MTSVARYDSVADFYVTEIGDSLDDAGTAGLLELVGDVRGKRFCDIACGQGRITRELARRGARVTGVDISAALLDSARDVERQMPLGVDYVHGDISVTQDLEPESFDGACCNFALTDIDDLSGTLNAISTLLRPGGLFVFSILHPCFPGWGADVSSSWQPGSGYFTEGWWRTDARSSRIRQRVGSNHRMISTYLNELSRCGLTVDRVVEPPPPERWLTTRPTADAVPTFLVLRATTLGPAGPTGQ